MTKSNPYRAVLVLVMSVGAMAGRAGAQPEPADGQSQPLARQSYRVRLLLAFDRHPCFTRTRRERIRRLTTAHVARVVGPAWQFTVEEDSELLGQCALDDSDQPEDELLRQRASGYDKLFVVAVRYGNGRLEIGGREHDTATGQTGPVFTRATGTLATLTHELLMICLQVFSPVARVDSTESRTASLTLKGGDIARGDPDLTWAPPGRPFSAFRRFFQHDVESPDVMPVPWTFVEVDEVRGASLTATVRSRLRRPFTRRTDRRNDIVALGLRSTGRPTRVRFVDDEDESPLFGYTATIQPTRQSADAVTVNTDRNGTVVVPPDSDGLSFVLLQQGTRRVAFLYLVPGHRAELTVPARARQSMLALSSELKSLEAEFIDLAARRAVLVTGIERYLAADEVASASAMLDELRSLRTQQQMDRRLSAYVANAQNQTGGSLPYELQERVDQLREQIRQHLNPARIGAVARRVREYQNAARGDQRRGTQSPDATN